MLEFLDVVWYISMFPILHADNFFFFNLSKVKESTGQNFTPLFISLKMITFFFKIKIDMS